MTTLRGWGFSDQHLALDALVAFVDGELTVSACDRAAAHLAGCPACSAEAAAQRQARAAVRSADTPSISSNLLRTLQSIPSEAELPGQPDELALSEDGQLVTVSRQDRASGPGGTTKLGAGPVLGSGRPLGNTTAPLGGGAPLGGEVSDHPQEAGSHGRRTRQGASVVFSGLVLGALVFMNFPADPEENTPANTGPLPLPGGSYDDAVSPASAPETAASNPVPSAPVPSSEPSEISARNAFLPCTASNPLASTPPQR